MSMTDYTPSAQEVKAVRETTGAGLMDCKRALAETAGDADAAVKLLRERGIAKMASRADRATGEGVIDAYVHGNGRIGVLVEIGCETDFVANTDGFREFAHEVALQIGAMPDTRWISRDDVPEDARQAELEIFKAQAADKPENIRERIAQGKLDKWYESVCLLEQPSIRDGDRTIEQMRAELSVQTKENVQIKRFARFQRGAA
jgi:elongation factor Ts